MKLNFSERLRMGFLFPQMGDMLELQIAHEIKEKIKLSVDEMKVVDYKRLPDGNAWFDDAKEPPARDFRFTNTEITFLQDKLDEKNKSKTIPAECFAIGQRIKKLELREEPTKTTAKKRK